MRITLIPLTLEASISPFCIESEKVHRVSQGGIIQRLSVPCVEYHIVLLGEDYFRQPWWDTVSTASDVLAALMHYQESRSLVSRGILKNVRLLSGWDFTRGNVIVIKTTSTCEIGGQWLKLVLPFACVCTCPLHLYDLLNFPCALNLPLNYASM
jgi:hypothetical protein